jgi:hypothetical protein
VLIGAYVYPPHHYSQCYLSAGCGGCTGSGEGASPAPIRPPPALEAGADGGGWTRQNGSKDTRSGAVLAFPLSLSLFLFTYLYQIPLLFLTFQL